MFKRIEAWFTSPKRKVSIPPTSLLYTDVYNTRLFFSNMAKEINKIILAYSGGLDTSVILHWLKEAYSAEVIAFTADLGQAHDPHVVESQAKEIGASKIIIKDLKEDYKEVPIEKARMEEFEKRNIKLFVQNAKIDTKIFNYSQDIITSTINIFSKLF